MLIHRPPHDPARAQLLPKPILCPKLASGVSSWPTAPPSQVRPAGGPVGSSLFQSIMDATVCNMVITEICECTCGQQRSGGPRLAKLRGRSHPNSQQCSRGRGQPEPTRSNGARASLAATGCVGSHRLCAARLGGSCPGDDGLQQHFHIGSNYFPSDVSACSSSVSTISTDVKLANAIVV